MVLTDSAAFTTLLVLLDTEVTSATAPCTPQSGHWVTEASSPPGQWVMWAVSLTPPPLPPMCHQAMTITSSLIPSPSSTESMTIITTLTSASTGPETCSCKDTILASFDCKFFSLE